MNKKRLKKEDGIILFLGTMNSMPMMYAIELKNLGYEVFYLVDRPKNDSLSRPENHFSSIQYPYPDWIIERIIPSSLLISYWPYYYYKVVIRLLKKKKKNIKIGAVFSSGCFIPLLKYFDEETVKIFLSHGADLEWFCNRSKINELAKQFRKKSFTQFLPSFLSNYIISKIVFNCINAAEKSDFIFFFPKGSSKIGDLVLEDLLKFDAVYVPRYDISFDIFKNFNIEYKSPGKILKILSPVRHHFYQKNPNVKGENKGNDIIIRGISKYLSHNSNIEVHFFEKGPDVLIAKHLCNELGLSEYIIWHKEMPLKELIQLYLESDICFDQVGDHLVGGSGMYAMYLGKPLIANMANINFLKDIPIYQAKTPDEVCNALMLITSNFNESLSIKISNYAKINFSPLKALSSVIE